MKTADWIALAGVAAAFIGLGFGAYKTISASRRRKRLSASVGIPDLYPVLRDLRDGSLAFIRPLGGGDPKKVIQTHRALMDLVDLEPLVVDEQLHRLILELLQQPAASIVGSIDPDRFEGLHLAQPGIDDLRVFDEMADKAVQRCQILRKGAT